MARFTSPGFDERQLLTLLSNRQIFYDDFVGSDLQKDIWTMSGDAGYTYDIGGSILQLFPDNVTGSVIRINWNNKYAYGVGNQVPITVIFNMAYVNSISKRFRFGLQRDDNNYVAFELNTDVDNNFRAVCNKVGTPTSEDTGLAFASHTPYLLKFIISSAAEVNFFINNVFMKKITTNVPTLTLEPIIEVETRANQALGIYLDKVIITANPYTISPP